MRSSATLSRPAKAPIRRAISPHSAEPLNRAISRIYDAAAELEILNKLSQAVVILDGKANVVAVNSCAEQLLEPPYRLSLRLGRLVAKDSAIETRLYRLVSQCAKSAAAVGQGPGGSLEIPADHGASSLALRVFPLRAPSDACGPGQSAVVVVLSAPQHPNDIDVAVLRARFVLTAAEIRLTTRLLRGASVKQASKELKVSENTARTHLKSIFAKVGVHRQAELVRVILPLVTEYRSR